MSANGAFVELRKSQNPTITSPAQHIKIPNHFDHVILLPKNATDKSPVKTITEPKKFRTI